VTECTTKIFITVLPKNKRVGEKREKGKEKETWSFLKKNVEERPSPKRGGKVGVFLDHSLKLAKKGGEKEGSSPAKRGGGDLTPRRKGDERKRGAKQKKQEKKSIVVVANLRRGSAIVEEKKRRTGE